MGGKVAAAVALTMQEDDHHDGHDNNNTPSPPPPSPPAATLELLSLTIMDISPVDYTHEPAFASVFATLETVVNIQNRLPEVSVTLQTIFDNASTTDLISTHHHTL